MSFLHKKRIFLDYASATPVLKSVQEEMERFWSRDFCNPSAIYKEGAELRRFVEECRTRIARITGASSRGIIFTSGGTESNNLAIMGAVRAFKSEINKKPHIVISSIEHPAVEACADEIERQGGEVSIVPVNEFGIVSPENVLRAVKHNTVMVSIMLANNEIGTVQNVAKIGRLVREYRKKNTSPYPYMHTDASQTPCFMDINIEKLYADLMTLDGAKIYGPKGIGALVVRGGVSLRPLLLGGGQEKGLRSGTESPALIAGFTKALETAVQTKDEESQRLGELQTYFVQELGKRLPDAVVNTPLGKALPNIVSVSVPGILSELILLDLDRKGILVSVGSSCSRDEMASGSPVIRALGKDELAESTIRFSFGRGTTKEELDKALNTFVSTVEHVRMSS